MMHGGAWCLPEHVTARKHNLGLGLRHLGRKCLSGDHGVGLLQWDSLKRVG